MDRVRTGNPLYVSQKSIASQSGASDSPMTSPMHRHVRSGSTGISNFRRTQNYAAKAAAQRLAQVMAHQPAEDDDDEDGNSSSSFPERIVLPAGRPRRSRSPANYAAKAAAHRFTLHQPVEDADDDDARSVDSLSNVTDLIGIRRARRSPSPAHFTSRAAAQRLTQVMSHQPGEDTDDDNLSLDGSSSSVPSSTGILAGRATRSPSPALGRNFVDLNPAGRSTSAGRPSTLAKPVLLVPSSKPLLRPYPAAPSAEPHNHNRREKRFSVDFGNLNIQETDNHRSASVLQDEIDVLQEENENILEKLRLAEERYAEAEARVRQLEKQVASLGEGVSLEDRLLSRKEAALNQSEAALKAASQTNGNRSDEIAALRLETETARDEALSAVEQLQEAESEIKSLRTMTQRMVLTQEEMEEVFLKRCWLARYWKLCVGLGIHAEIAEPKHEYWSSLAPLPIEAVLSAGQKAKEEGVTEKVEVPWDSNDMGGEGNIESMLSVEKGLRELASLKVEDAVLLAMAYRRRPNSVKAGESVTDLNVPIDSHHLVEAFELSQEECEDVLFKQAWLTYFWRRAKNHGLEQDIVDERLQFWINQRSVSPTSHDLVDVQRGLHELRMLGIETQLWEASRRVIGSDSVNPRLPFDADL
ncbi:coiled-coil domain-containing protein SCD2-like [Tasmannia lanceolata]|uniref:coiled-coil domain-containing protein SCD2-like n=1 Tax=Tasmannia lanceolata TaxID=3420 RepID=UPI004064201A